MTLSRYTRAFGAMLLLASIGTAAHAQTDTGVTIAMTDMTAPIIAGHDVDMSFTVTNASTQDVAGIVAVLVDPTGRTLSTRAIHSGTIPAGATFSKSPTERVPPRAIPGTYSMSLEARAADGTTLASTPRQFDVLSTTRAFATPGMEFVLPEVSSSVAAGGTFSAHVQVMNETPHTINRVYAVVIDPTGRVLTARSIHGGDIGPAALLDKVYREGVAPNAMIGTYQVQIQCRSTEGQILSTSPFSFDVTPATAGLRTAERLTAFPNPAVNQATLRFALADDASASLSVYDALGRQVSTPLSGAVRAGRTESSVDVSALPPGLYVARLMVEGGESQTTRFTVAR